MIQKVSPKKHLGQHFLLDLGIAKNIVDALQFHNNYQTLTEIGPGMGVLTDFLIENKNIDFSAVEIDTESVKYLHKKYPNLKVIEGDFLQMDVAQKFGKPFGIIGNFPYNISSQIFFKVLDHRDLVQEVVCMLQKEVAERLCSGPGNREYGILSVFLQAFYDLEYLFTVEPKVFDPPPKVKSGVIRVTRNKTIDLGCDEVFFRKVVKQSFSMRRKTLRNCLKPMSLPVEYLQNSFFDQRAEQLGFKEYIRLTNEIQAFRKAEILQ